MYLAFYQSEYPLDTCDICFIQHNVRIFCSKLKMLTFSSTETKMVRNICHLVDKADHCMYTKSGLLLEEMVKYQSSTVVVFPLEATVIYPIPLSKNAHAPTLK